MSDLSSLTLMKTNKPLSARQKAARAGVSVAHYCAVLRHTARPSYQVALKIAQEENVDWRHFMDPEVYDERGKTITATQTVE